MQLQHNLSIQQQELIQQLQLVQRQYLIHQGLVKPLHLNLQTQLQSVLSSAPVVHGSEVQTSAQFVTSRHGKMPNLIHEDEQLQVDNEHFQRMNDMHTEDLESEFSNSNNNNNTQNYNTKKLVLKQEQSSEIKLEYGSLVDHQCSSSEQSNRLETNSEADKKEDDDDENEHENEIDNDEETRRKVCEDTTQDISNLNSKSKIDRNIDYTEKLFPPWPQESGLSVLSNSTDDINNNINDRDFERGENSRNMVHINSHNTKRTLRKRRASPKADSIQKNFVHMERPPSPSDDFNVPQMCIYQVPPSHYRTSEELSPSEQQSKRVSNSNGSLYAGGHQQVIQELGTKQYYHPLFLHGVCRWPGCELALDDVSAFVK